MDIRRKVLNLKTASLALTLAAAFIMSSRADTPGAHPAYIHARNDLRRARLYVEVKDSPEVHDHLHYARIEIDKAIAEIDHAAAMDHKAIIDTPDIDATLDRPGRLHKAVDLLRSARKDISGEETDKAAIEWKNVAYYNIDKAIDSCKAAAKALGVTGL